MTTFRWQNCYADILTSKHDVTIHSYLDDVIVPALATLPRRSVSWGRATGPATISLGPTSRR